MTLETIYYTTQIIAVVLIFTTLVFLAIQNRQSQKQMERANEIARAEYSGKIMRINTELLSQLIEDGELGLAFRQLLIENKWIEDKDMLFRLMMWFFNYSILWMDTVSADEKGLVDKQVVNMVSGAQAFHLTFPVVWDAMVRTLSQRGLDSGAFENIISRMVALRDNAKAREWDAANLLSQQHDAPAETIPSKMEPGT